ncbi:MAG: efflux RND transporter periplasmic adaptor subunit [Betaproteobacteria bacterium HGW-Betaproteobacteria-12]|jgi:cobalt-zinc-cadmium efflux system membrane fusion protein|nr:MAG: efflux RND transporter periplasmic adaptor subunit [Betaproteobacteria bacterium HGW-Betaproteobacteria-12]
MTPKNIRLLCGAALLVALGTGFGLAQFIPHSEHAAHAEDDEHAAHDDPNQQDEHEDAPSEEGVVALTARQIEASGIGVVGVGRGGGNEYRLSGRVESAVGARAVVAAITGGRVEQIHVAPGSSVEAGQLLAVIVSGDAATLRANADATVAEAEAARLAYQRDLNLVEQGIVARQDMEASRARSLAADAAARAAQAQVAASGSPNASGRFSVVSPIAGVVGAVSITAGGFVASGGAVVEISDPAQVELVFTAPPALASEVTSGTRLQVRGPSDSFEAVVVGVAANAREQSGAAVIRARSTSSALPPAGSPVTGIVVTNDQEGVLTVPADSVQTVEGRSVVFVTDDNGFRVTPVLAGRRAGGYIEILNGLSGDERIAGTNAFLLKAELAKGEAEHGH